MDVPLSALLIQEKKQRFIDQSETIKVDKEIKKQIYFIIGEPRTGKTTLGIAASFSCHAIILDTDQFSEDEVINEILHAIGLFINSETTYLLFIIIGKHRKQNTKIIRESLACTGHSALVTICKLERAHTHKRTP